MREWRVLAEIVSLAGLSHSLVEYVKVRYKQIAHDVGLPEFRQSRHTIKKRAFKMKN
jgi:hypothetical protein